MSDPAITMDTLKMVGWFAGSIFGVVSVTATIIMWINKQLKRTRIDLFTRINSDLKESQGVSVRVSLLEQAHTHHESRMDGMDIKMDVMLKDITDIKDKFTRLSQKQAENHLTIVGEIRNLGDKMTIKQLQEQNK